MRKKNRRRKAKRTNTTNCDGNPISTGNANAPKDAVDTSRSSGRCSCSSKHGRKGDGCPNDGPSHIKKALGLSIPCFVLSEYLQQFYDVSNMDTLFNSEHLDKIVIAPFHNHPTTTNSTEKRFKFTPSISEPLESLIDGVIAALVNRSQRYIRETTGRSSSNENSSLLVTNVLALGYQIASQNSNLGYCCNMPPGITCYSPNTIALFAKTSPIMIRLHAIVGDSVLRQILLNSIMLLPASVHHCCSNYVQLCGPPLHHVISQGKKKPTERKRPVEDSSKDIVSRKPKKQKTIPKEASIELDVLSKQTSSLKNADKLWDPNEPLPRRRLFFCEGYFKKVGLPKSHSLNNPPSPKNYTDLLNSIIKFKDGSQFNRRRWKRLRHTGIDMVQRIHHGHLHKCDYHRILDRHCPLPINLKGGRNKNEKSQVLRIEDLVAAHTPAKRVTSFVKEALRTTFPKDFWGSDHNYTTFLKTVEKFIHMRRYEEMPLKAITKGIRVLDFHWLLSSASLLPSSDNKHDNNLASTISVDCSTRTRSCSSSDHAATTKLVQQTLRWVYVAYIIPLLRSTFYITDSEFSAMSVLYYRRPVWSALRRHGIKSLLSDGHFVEVGSSNINELEKYFSVERNIGLPKLRLLPKTKGIRPIALLSNSVKYTIFENKVINERTTSASRKRITPPNIKLRPIFDILKFEQARNSTIFGCGVYGMDRITSLLAEFKKGLSKSREMISVNASTAEEPPLYFVSVDIRHCYDKINQEYLFNLIPEILIEEDYLIQKHCVLKEDRRSGRLRGKITKKVVLPEGFLNIQRIAEQHYQSKSIFVDSVNCNLLKKEGIMELLKKHIFDHMVVVNGNGSTGPRFFLQKNGIPQGSVLSSLLCNIYYGKIEQSLLSGVFDEYERWDSHFLVRIVDDFLFITTNKAAATRFVHNMYKGIPDLGVEINKGKTLLNFDMEVADCDGILNTLQKWDSKEQFPWCGILFHTATCDVKVDYSRFMETVAIDSLTVSNVGMEGEALPEKMRSFIRPRLRSFLYDSIINTETTSIINFYQAHLFCAIKTMHYVNAMEGGVESNVMYVVRCINDLVAHSYYTVSRLLQSILKNKTSQGRTKNVWSINSLEAKWLGRDAYIQVMRKVKSFSHLARQLFKLNAGIDKERLKTLKRLSTFAFTDFEVWRFALKS